MKREKTRKKSKDEHQEKFICLNVTRTQWFQMEQTKVSFVYYIEENPQCLCGFRKYLKYLLIKNFCTFTCYSETAHIRVLKIPPTSTSFSEASVTLSFQHHGLHRKWNSYSFNQPQREKNTTKPLTIYVSRSWSIFVHYFPPPPSPGTQNRNLYEVIWHSSFDTPEFSHLLNTHNTIHVTEIQFSVLQLRSVLLFLPLYFTSSQWLTARLTSFLVLHTKRQARDQYCGLQVNKSSHLYITPRKETDPIFHSFTVYCSLPPSGP
jgi:hypothetical protein